jgi:hypothetical protein
MIVSRLVASTVGSSEASDHGASARFAPLIVENENVEWRLVACAAGPRRARVLVRQAGAERVQAWVFEDETSDSSPQVVVLALLDALARLRLAGARNVTVVALDKTLRGYLFHGWRVRSLAMHDSLLRLMAAARGLEVSFEVARF